MYVPKKHKNKSNINTKEKQRKTNSEPKKLFDLTQAS